MRKRHAEKTELEKRWEAEINAKDEGAPQPPADAEAVNADPQQSPETDEELPSVELLPEADVAALTEERDRLRDQLLRLRAEFDNYRKRMARDEARTRRLAAEAVMRDLLPVLDNLERALAHARDESGGLAQGVDMVHKQIQTALGRHGLEAIPALGQPFDTRVHEAILSMPAAETPPDHVVREFQKGYRLGDYVLRHSKVAVSAAPEPPAADVPPGQSDETKV